MENPVVLELAEKYNKTPAQVLLRHLIQKDFSVIPKSSNPKRIAENINVSFSNSHSCSYYYEFWYFLRFSISRSEPKIWRK